MNVFAQTLYELIKEKGISQSQLADYLKVRQQTVSKYTYGKVEPGFDTLIKLAKYFDVSTDYLLGLEN